MFRAPELRTLDQKLCSRGPIVILGANGQLGRALVAILAERARPLTRAEADLTNPTLILGGLARYAPSAVINAAAYTQVDRAETEEELASTINGETPGVIARWCVERGIPFVHVSTDYVFSGEGERPWSEEDATAPQNAYGRSKLAGERAVAQAGGNHLIFRTSWVYDATGKNFFNTMARLGAEQETLRVVADQKGAPTYAPHLAHAILRALNRAIELPVFPSGTYHLAGSGETSWHQFASAIFEELRKAGAKLKVSKVEPIQTTEFKTPAKRPLNSRLNQGKVRDILGIKMPDWKSGLKECMNQKIAVGDLKRESTLPPISPPNKSATP